MKNNTGWMTALTVLIMGAAAAGPAWAHCDTTSGPIIPEARAALEKGDVTPVLKWIKAENEAPVKQAFEKAVKVRAQGPEAKELADQYFLETLIRLHRAGEGEPFTGIKTEPLDPFTTLVEKTLADGKPDELIKRMSGHLDGAVREKFAAANDAAKTKDQSVEAGRKYVEAYVTYLHYLEGIRGAIMSQKAHHAE